MAAKGFDKDFRGSMSKKSKRGMDLGDDGPEEGIEYEMGKVCNNFFCEQNTSPQGFALLHRHSTEQCKDHVFCAPGPWPWRSDLKHTQPFETQYALTAWQQAQERLEAEPHKKKEPQTEKTYGGILGSDREIASDRKAIVTDVALDTWVAAHYGFGLDRIPRARPNNMPK